MTLILGTSSQFRRKFFQENFSEFLISDGKFEQFISPDIDEKAIRDSDYEKLCQKIAIAKCDAILKDYQEKLPQDSIILTFDQVVVCKGQLREKPVDEAQARKFLKSYSGNHFPGKDKCIRFADKRPILVVAELAWVFITKRVALLGTKNFS